MGKKAKGKHRLDKFYYLAKEQGYRSRAAFKLIQLNRKYDFLSKSRAVLDLCAAPGGWLQVAAKHMPVSSLIIGVDLAPIKAIRGVKTFIGDITTQKCRQQLKKESGGSLMDTVLHDGAPNVGGAWSSEAYTQSNLVLESLKLATEFLAPNGTFVTKVFRSKDYTSLLYAFNQLFNKVEATKPVASRNASAEIFVVCLGYKAPAKIDPRLLDPRHLFQEVHELAPNAGPQALLQHKLKKQRNREGYVDGLSTTHKATSAAAFILGDNPVEMLGNYTKFVLEGTGCTDRAVQSQRPGADADDAGKEGPTQGPAVSVELAVRVANHASTTPEIKTLCCDLQVLGRSEFKLLLKWRLKIRKELDMEAKAAAKEGDKAVNAVDDEMAAGNELTEDEKMLMEMAELKEKMELQRKKDRRRRHELKIKARIRATQLAKADGINDAGVEEELFSLSALKGRDAVEQLDGIAALDQDELAYLEAPSSSEASMLDSSDGQDSADDSDAEARRYDDNLNKGFEEAFQSYLVRQKLRKEAADEAAANKKRKRIDMEHEMATQGDVLHTTSDVKADELLAQPVEDDEEVGAGLVVSLDGRTAGRPVTAQAHAEEWFSQDLFNDPLLVEQDTEMQTAYNKHASRKQQKRKAALQFAEADDDDEEGKADATQAQMVEGKGTVSQAGRQSGQVAGEAGLVGPAAVVASVQPKIGRTKARKQAGASDAVRFDSEDDADGSNDEEDPGALLRIGQGVQRPQGEYNDGFEVVAEGAEASDEHASSDSEQEFEDLDDHSKVEIRAIAKRMLRARQRNDIVEASYNRYAFNDEDVLPTWFAMEEKRHTRPMVELSRQELEDAKAALKAVDARPIKKVAEARARKRKRLAVKLTAAKQKAEAIAGQEDVPASSKMREIEKVMAKARSSGKGKASKGQKGRGKGRKGPPLDSRMKSDKRQVNMKVKKAAEKKRKRKGAKSKARRARA